MIRVHAPSRLHFGLFRARASAGPEGLTGRRFGGVGLMVDSPGLRLAVHRDDKWSAVGPLAERALRFARRFAETFPPGTIGPHRLIVEQAPPEHVGMGTGTQLGLAVARVLAISTGSIEMAVSEMARRVGRGERSALGIHGFEHGGFLVEAGKQRLEDVSPLVARFDFPEEWRVLLVSPARQVGLHGDEERRAFQKLENFGPSDKDTDALCRLTLLDLLPALAERNLTAFGEALYEFNARVGQTFAPVQGGAYASPQVTELVAFLRRQGIRGVGQSSWGPTVFAILAAEKAARDLGTILFRQFGFSKNEVILTCGRNQGATFTQENPI